MKKINVGDVVMLISRSVEMAVYQSNELKTTVYYYNQVTGKIDWADIPTVLLTKKGA
ncbi:MAG: hypothetical protein JNL72_09590 [Flavipsychrobacter sp.]|nr:hypothetical protein [Flavipsychrobacter sp.]